MVLRPVISTLSVMLLTFTLAEAQERPQAEPASSPVQSFETLAKRVKPGATVYVTEAASGEVEGRLLRISPGSVTLLVQGTEREFLKSDVRQVARRGDSLKNGALIGMGAAAVWAVIGALRTEDVQTNDIDDPETALVLVGIPVFVAMGAGVGTLIDAGIKGKTVVYRSAQRTITAHPIISPRQIGLGVAVRF